MKWQEFKFPKTPYIFSKGTREDKILDKDKVKLFLESNVIIQEKIDGNNLMIFADEAGPHFKSRSSIVTGYDTKFKSLDLWYKTHEKEIKKISDKNLYLIGEWVFWKHSIHYLSLPSYFIAYDIFDANEQKFLSQKKVSRILNNTKIVYNQPIYEGSINGKDNLEHLIENSNFGASKKEGLVIRIDDENYNIYRAKYVPKEFTEGIKKHWVPKEKNRLKYDITH